MGLLSKFRRIEEVVEEVAAEIIPLEEDDSLLSYVWPASYKSAPVWAGVAVVLGTYWLQDFFWKVTPGSIKREENTKRAKYLCYMEALVEWRKEKLNDKEKKLKGQNSTQEDKDSEEFVEDETLPEASRLLDLLYDDVFLCRTTKYGELPLTEEVEDMFRAAERQDLRRAITLTSRARELLKPGSDSAKKLSSEELKKLAEHESGEKLHAAVQFAEKAQKYLGKGFVDPELLAEAKAVSKQVYHQQSSNQRALWHLIAPAIPFMMVGWIASIVNCALRGNFHAIGNWAAVIEKEAEGDHAGALSGVFSLWVGHMMIEFIQQIDTCYVSRATRIFQTRIRNGVLSAMLRQDYEYFDRHQSGILQDRLNRDSGELGENLVRFPQRMLHRLAWITVNLIWVWSMVPRELLLPAFAPLFVTLPMQYFCFSWNRKSHRKQGRVNEKAVAATSEILREIKTVRQFAMESSERCNYAQGELNRSFMMEGMEIVRCIVDMIFWSCFCTGLFATMYLGLPYVRRGEMKASELLDVVFRINCHLSFPIRDILDELPRMSKLLQPLGRICDLLQASPIIEPPSYPAFVDVKTPAALKKVLDRCGRLEPPAGHEGADVRTILQGGLADLLDDEDVSSVATKDASSSAKDKHSESSLPTKGSEVVSLATTDHQYVRVLDKLDLDLESFSYPVRVVFSRGIRPVTFKGHIEFQNVTFAYPTDLRKKVLNGLSFAVEPGQKVALVGSTGCGKSSCMSLLQRLYDPQGGRILIDGIPLKDYDIHYLRSRIVIVDQNTVLFHTTIRENIAYGCNVTDAEVIQACKDAKAWEFISEKPDKLQTMISDGGKNLSGGQRQRLAIARAMVRKPDVILLDEATSALDSENEVKVQAALDEFARRGSALVIAHRLSTIKDSDKIVVVDKGIAVEIGSHAELLAGNDEDEEEDTKKGKEGEDGEEDEMELERRGSDLLTVGDGSSRKDKLGPMPSMKETPKLGLQKTASARIQKGISDDDTSLGVPAPELQKLSRRGSTSSIEPRLSSRSGVSDTTSYKKLWNAATGSQDKLTLAQIEKKLQDMEKELRSLRRRRSEMQRIKNHLLEPLRASSSSSTRNGTSQVSSAFSGGHAATGAVPP